MHKEVYLQAVIFFGSLEMHVKGDSNIWTWHTPGMTVGAWEHFVPAASVGRREEERQPTSCTELRGDCTTWPLVGAGAVPEGPSHAQAFITVEVKNESRTMSLHSM